MDEGGEAVRFSIVRTQFGEQAREIEGLTDDSLTRVGSRVDPVLLIAIVLNGMLATIPAGINTISGN